jgi:N-acetyl-anhydromuramyl-L-alanine amidase AmpD
MPLEDINISEDLARIPIAIFRGRNYGRQRTSEEWILGMLVHSMGEWVVGGDGQRHYAPEFLDTLRLSVHAMITPGGMVIQVAPDDRITWHAGVSKFEGKTNLNKYFLGCEFLVKGTHTYGSFLRAIDQPGCYTEQQYRAGGYWYAKRALANLAVTPDSIVGHSTVSSDAVRGAGKGKRDPGAGFDWDRFWEWFNWFYDRL